MNTNTSESGQTDRRKYIDTDAFFNEQYGAVPLNILPGEYESGKEDKDMIVATIGSGVAVSIYDKDLHIGGLAYVLLPEEMIQAFPHFDQCDPALIRASTKPIDDCIGALKRMGAGKGRIRIRLTGGANMPGDDKDRGTKNYIFVKEYLTRKGLVVMSEDLSGEYLRRVHFFPSSGRAVRRTLRRKSDFIEMAKDEEAFHNKHGA